MAIIIERTITVKNNISTLDNPLYLYTGDGSIVYLFTIKEIKKAATFGKISTTNSITDEISYGEVRIYKPDDELVFTARAEIIDDKLRAEFSSDNIDQLTEAGVHQLQIHLYDADVNAKEENRYTIPPVDLNVLFPVGTTNSVVGQAITDYSLIRINEPEGYINAFDSNGDYNVTYWNTSDKITAAKLNKIEEGISTLSGKVKNPGSSGNMDTSDFVTRNELNNYVTKDEMNNYATKDDIGNINIILDNINGESI
jgi:hypothetical protein